MPVRKLLYVMMALGIALSAPLFAQTPALMVRLGTLVPAGSPWNDALRSMDVAVRKATENRVGIQVFASAAPTEQIIINRMQPLVKGFDAATMMIAGLGSIDKSFNVFGMPFFFESDAEYEHVQRQLTPMIGRRLEAKGYHLINWGSGGWVRLFSKTALKSVADVKAARLYTTVGDQETISMYEKNGYHVVPLQTSQIAPSLNSGAITATPSPPVYAVPLQIFRYAKYMLDLPLGPLPAATVIADHAWQRISQADRAKLLEVGATTEKTINSAAPVLDRQFIDQMKAAGLQVVPVDSGATAEFRAEAARLAQSQRGTLVPADVFDEALRIRDAYRKTRK